MNITNGTFQNASDPAAQRLPRAAKVKSALLDQLRAQIRVRHYSIRTEHTYVDWASGQGQEVATAARSAA